MAARGAAGRMRLREEHKSIKGRERGAFASTGLPRECLEKDAGR
mgnify:CR=1 FL=1